MTTKEQAKGANWAALARVAGAALLITAGGAAAVVGAAEAQSAIVRNTAMVFAESAAGGSFVVYSNTDSFEVAPAPPVAPSITLYKQDIGSDLEIRWRAYRSEAPTAPASSSGNRYAQDIDDGVDRARVREAAALAYGEPFMLVVNDFAANKDASAPDFVEIDLRFGVDRERLWLSETGPRTGEFVALLRPTLEALQPGNGALEINPGRQLIARYEPLSQGAVAIEATADVGGAYRVFDSATGEPLTGARVRLLDAETGESALAYGIDGVSPFPASLESGRDVSDAAGNLYAMEAGEFLFPRLPPGRYRLQIDVSEADGYAFPSAATDDALRALPGAFAISAGSRGVAFEATGEPLELDAPLDPLGGNFSLSLRSDAQRVSIGDFFEVKGVARNRNGFADLVEARVEVALPPGMRIASGSLRIDGHLAVFTPIQGGERFAVHLGEIERRSEVELRFVVSVAYARKGIAVVSGIGRARRAESNDATFALRVDDDLMASTAHILGRVVISEDGESTGEGLPNVPVYLETGALAITDEMGRFHFEGLEPGARVAQIDVSALPAGHRAVVAPGASRDKAFSRLLDLQPGSLWQVEFHVERAPAAAIAAAPASQPEPEKNESFAYDRAWLERQTPEDAWLLPAEGALPALPVARIVVKHRVAHKIEASLNGAPLAPRNFSGTMAKSDRSFAVSAWEGVPLSEGDNVFEIVKRDSFGNERGRESRSIHYSSPPWDARLDPAASLLVANGKDSPIIAVRLLDKDGFPAREGVTGVYSVDAPHRPVGFRDEDMRLRPGVAAKLPTYVVEKGGWARIALEPTTVSGNARIHFPLPRGDVEIVAPLRGDRTDWIVVGIADGTLAYDTLAGRMEAIPAGEADAGYAESGRVALFAKGKIRGSWLLTAAYDSAKRAPSRGSLGDAVDPDAYYTLYGDESLSLEDAPSRKKLYLKIERDAWAALYGNFQLDWKSSDFTRMDTAMHGAKADYRGEKLAVSVFRSEAGMRFGREEFRGHGAAGDYQLSRGGLAPFSESVVVETRDRRRESLVLDARELRRDLDYTIDYARGSIRLNKPLFTTDADLNDQHLVVQYELFDASSGEVSGARAEARLMEGLDLGATMLRREDDFGASSLQSIDASAELPLEIEATLEVARSESVADTANAYSATLQRRTERTDTELRYQEAESGFGLGNVGASQLGKRSIGLESRQQLGGGYGLRQSAYEDSELDTLRMESVAEVEALYDVERSGYSLGLRAIEERDELGSKQQLTQVIAGTRQTALDDRLEVRAQREQSLDPDARIDEFPTRTILSADYRIVENYELNLAQEWNERGDESDTLTRVGVTAEPWAGTEIMSVVSKRGGSESGSDLQNSIVQSWQVTPRWEIEGGFERAFAIEEGPSSGAGADDATSLYVEAHYVDDVNAYDARVERYEAESTSRVGLAASAKRKQTEELGLLAGIFATASEGGGATADDIDARLGIVWRPGESGFALLNRLDFKTSDQSSADRYDSSRRIVNNAHAFFELSDRDRLSLHLGAKYALYTFADERYDSVSYFLGGDYRHEFLEVWDVGLHGRNLGNFATASQQVGYGMSIGRRFGPDMWASVGYNVEGVDDLDFEDSSYTRQGPYVRFRLKFDQDSLAGLLERIGER